MPLVVCSIFYVPIGLQISADWLSGRFSRGRLVNNPNPQLWFIILVAVGVAICLPKLLRPLRIEKQGYMYAAKWLLENTAREDIVAVPDMRIYFYAERDGFKYESEKEAARARYFVRIVESEDEELNLGRAAQEEHSLWLDKRKKKHRLVIYKVM